MAPLLGTLTPDSGYARTYVSERQDARYLISTHVRPARPGRDGIGQRGRSRVRSVRQDVVREPAGPPGHRRPRGRGGPRREGARAARGLRRPDPRPETGLVGAGR